MRAKRVVTVPLQPYFGFHCANNTLQRRLYWGAGSGSFLLDIPRRGRCASLAPIARACVSLRTSEEGCAQFQRAPNPTEFAQPRLSRVKARSSPARGYKLGCVCSYMAGHYPGILMTGHVGTNTPKFAPPRGGRPRFDPPQSGLRRFRWVWSSLTIVTKIDKIFLTYGATSLGLHHSNCNPRTWWFS